MKYLHIALLGAALAFPTTRLAQAAQKTSPGNISVNGAIVSQNSCSLEMKDNVIAIGEHHYKNLSEDQSTQLYASTTGNAVTLAVKCLQETPLALKFSTTGAQPTADGKYHSMTLGDIGSDVKQNVAYADIKISVIGSHYVFSGQLEDPFDISNSTPARGLTLIHGFPNSVSEPERSGITLVDATGQLEKITSTRFYFMVDAHATPTKNWKDSMTEASKIPLQNTFTITAVYL